MAIDSNFITRKIKAMLEKSFTILFYQKKRSNYVKGPIPIYLRITVDGIPKELSVKRAWDPLRWNKAICRAIGGKEDARALNEFPEMLHSKFYEAIAMASVMPACCQAARLPPHFSL